MVPIQEIGWSQFEEIVHNDHDPCKYLRDVLERLPVMPEPQLEALLPHVWKPADAGRVH